MYGIIHGLFDFWIKKKNFYFKFKIYYTTVCLPNSKKPVIVYFIKKGKKQREKTKLDEIETCALILTVYTVIILW